jgi:arylsulfatase
MKRPNVLIVMTDDQGLGDFSFLGNPILKTPGLDNFARESVRLADFHVAPMCTPTRSQLMTGVVALRNGACAVSGGRSVLRAGLPTLAEVFARAGYKTGLFGKWHLGDSYPHRPIDRGFQESVYHLGWGMLHAVPEFDNPLIDGRYFHNGQPQRFQGHCTDLWFDQATRWIKGCQAQGEPFFCYLAPNAPHTPHVELPKFVEPYQGKGPAGFFGMIAHVDQRFAQLDEFLKASGLRDNTIVIFMTDNGGTAGVATFNAGLRDAKTSYYEGGHRVPCWLRWPGGNLGKARDIADPTQNTDLFPTLLDLCGIARPEGAQLDGTSLADLLRGKVEKLPDRMLVVQYGWQPQKGDACVLWGKWRLVKNSELYDSEADRAQKTDLAGQQPEVVKKMRDHYEKWWAGVEPLLADFTPCAILGTERQPEVTLTSAEWETNPADDIGHVRLALGGPTGGRWCVEVAKPGEYEIGLRRWPRDLKIPLGARHDATGELEKLGGKAYAPPSVAFPSIAAVQVRIAGKEVSAKTSATAQEVSVKLTLPAGKTTLKAWFQDDAGKDLCGAFFVSVRRVK